MVSKKEKKTGKKPSMLNKFYPIKIPVTAVMMIKIGKSEIPILITQNTENIMSTLFANRIKKCLDNECIRIGEKTIQHVTIESKHGFLKSTSIKFKKKRGFRSTMGKKHQCTNKFWNNKKTKN